MKLPEISRLRWNRRLAYGIGLILFLCGIALLTAVARRSATSMAASPGAMPGVHLGNVPGGWFWDEKYFSRIRGEEENYPGVIVVMSDQVYQYDRSTPNCSIAKTFVPTDPPHQAVWNYLREASEQPDVEIVIRINPSPGYFEGDRLVPGPADDFCGLDGQRSAGHVADEICQDWSNLKDWTSLGGER